MRVLEDEVAGGDREGGMKGLIGARDFEFAVAGEGCGGLEREDELLVDGEVVFVSEMYGRVA